MSKNLEKIYREIATAVSAEEAEKNRKPIISFLGAYGFREVDANESGDAISRYVLDDGDDKIEARIESYDHSRTCEIRPDSNHNYLELCEDGKVVDRLHYVFWDEM